MSRRLAGALLVLLTIVGVTVVSSVSGRRLAGEPIGVEFPDPPAVGDCLLETPADWPQPGPDVSASRFGTCGTTVTFGEVVAVRPATSLRSAALPNPEDCRADALAYAGLRQLGRSFVLTGESVGDPVDWAYSIAITSFWIPQVPSLPTASKWEACVATPTGIRLGDGILARAFSDGALPADYGTCWQSIDIGAGMDMVNCNLPHIAELVAIGRMRAPSTVDRERIVASCQEQARLMLRRSDPTAAGTLAVNVRPDRLNTARRTPPNLTCYITSADHRRIIGSLVGLGIRDVAFTE